MLDFFGTPAYARWRAGFGVYKTNGTMINKKKKE